MTQEKLDTYHEYTLNWVTQYCNGLLTLAELQAALATLDLKGCAGFIDPRTGLKYS